MTFGIRILCFDAECEAEQYRFGVLELIGVLFQTQERATPSQELFFVHWLAQKIICAARDSFYALVDAREPCHENDWNKTRLRPRLNGKTGVKPCLDWHHDVK